MRRLSLMAIRPEALAFLAVLAAALLAAFLSFRAPAQEPPAPAPRVTVTLAKAQQLVAATSGPAAAQMQAVGEQAKLINAAMPVGAGPVHAARPFALPGGATDYDRALTCLTQAVYYEAGFEPLTGRRAVAQVVLNRMRHPAFPKSVCGVVYQASSQPVCQFSFVCDGSLNRPAAQAAWRQSREIAAAALAGYVERSVGAATHYHADYVAPRWAPMLTKITKLGTHIFYRWPGGWGMPGAFNGRYIGEPRDPLALRPAIARPLVEATIDQVIESGPVTDGTLLKRAPTDVGGLLDVSKGWTLSLPDDTGSAVARALAQQQKDAPGEPKPAAALAPSRAIAGSME